MSKQCYTCKETKPLSEFRPMSRSADGLMYSCKDCYNEYQVAYRKRNLEKKRGWQKKAYKKMRESPEKWERMLTKTKDYIDGHKERYLLWKTRSRSKEGGIPNNLDESDIVIPETCPVLGIPIERSTGKHSDNSPTVDRINPELGYVKGNVLVVSFKANRLKSNATVEELRKVYEFYAGMVARLRTD